MTNAEALRTLKTLRREVLADGRIDFAETDALLAFVGPLAEKGRDGCWFEEFRALLARAREDGRITADESARLTREIDWLIGYLSAQRLRVLLIAAMAFVGVVILALRFFA